MGKFQTPDQCQHPGCRCPRPATGDYCRDYCENAQSGGMAGDCKCGHPECAE